MGADLLGLVAKKKRGCLQNTYARVQFPSRPQIKLVNRPFLVRSHVDSLLD